MKVSEVKDGLIIAISNSASQQYPYMQGLLKPMARFDMRVWE